MTEPSVLNVSKSAVDAYRQCQQLYYYRYFQRLRRRDRAKPLELGSLLHRYLELYYKGVQAGMKPLESHQGAQLGASAEFAPSIKQSVDQLIKVGLRELAAEMQGLIPLAGRLTDRYYLVHGESDAEEFEILLVEEWMNLDLLAARGELPLTRSNSKLDMLTRSRVNGRVHLWEDKSAADIPETSIRLRDLQTTLYAEKLFKLGMIPERVDAVLWNYLRTKEPTVPELLKNGKLTLRKDLDSTWDVYSAAIDKHKLNHADYQEQRQRLEGREETHFFPRHEQVILADARRLLGDYVQTAKDIRLARRAWELQTQRPVRSLSRNCDWCEFARLCNAALLAGTDRDARSDFITTERAT